MKYIKYFENNSISYLKDLQDQKDDIIKILTKYCKDYADDKLHHEIESLLWEYSDTSDRYEDVGEIDGECIRLLVDNLLESSERRIGHFLDVYYDCSHIINKHKESLFDQLEEIFADYKDEGMSVKIAKSSEWGDDRYVVNIHVGDNDEVLTKISFSEVINRAKDIGLTNLEFSGNNIWIRLEFSRDDSDDDLREPDTHIM